MTVSELIAELQKFPPDAPVAVCGDDYYTDAFAAAVSEEWCITEGGRPTAILPIHQRGADGGHLVHPTTPGAALTVWITGTTVFVEGEG